MQRISYRLPVEDVQADELWAFVGCKEKTRLRLGYDDQECGDSYCFTALERNTKMVIAWHLGKRTPADTLEFAQKLRHATDGRFQLTTDGYGPYRNAVPFVFGPQLAFSQLVKVYRSPREGATRYSPGEVIGTHAIPVTGDPDPTKVCTSHVERSNLTVRTTLRRYTRLTNAFSKKWANHEAALSLFFVFYNYCRVHSTIKCTPATKAGLADHTWSVKELVMKSSELLEVN